MHIAALILSTAILAADPEADAAEQRADTAFAAGDFDTAIFHLDDAVRRNPLQQRYYAKRGAAKFYGKRYESAIDDYTEALRMEPRNATLYHDRGLSRWKIGQAKASADDFRKALELDPNNHEAMSGLAWALATSPDAELRDGKRAVELATKACEMSGWKNPYHLSTLAAAHAEAGNFEEALRRHREAMALPNYPIDKLERARQRLALYEQHKPFREVIEK
jgi:tetratricopeptide (TPR) repeat protein